MRRDLEQSMIAAVEAAETDGSDRQVYALSFAAQGQSGASVGRMQTDLAQRGNEAQREQVAALIRAHGQAFGIGDEARTQIAGSLSDRRPSPLLGEYDAQLHALLAGDAGRAVIDRIDRERRGELVRQVETVLQHAARNPHGPGQFDPVNPDPAVLAATARWINQSGPPTKLLAWIEGRTVTLDRGRELEPPARAPELADLHGYLRATAFYRQQAPSVRERDEPRQR